MSVVLICSLSCPRRIIRAICSLWSMWVEKITTLSGAAGGKYAWSFRINQRNVEVVFPASAKNRMLQGC